MRRRRSRANPRPSGRRMVLLELPAARNIGSGSGQNEYLVGVGRERRVFDKLKLDRFIHKPGDMVIKRRYRRLFKVYEIRLVGVRAEGIIEFVKRSELKSPARGRHQRDVRARFELVFKVGGIPGGIREIDPDPPRPAYKPRLDKGEVGVGVNRRRVRYLVGVIRGGTLPSREVRGRYSGGERNLEALKAIVVENHDRRRFLRGGKSVIGGH